MFPSSLGPFSRIGRKRRDQPVRHSTSHNEVVLALDEQNRRFFPYYRRCWVVWLVISAIVCLQVARTGRIRSTTGGDAPVVKPIHPTAHGKRVALCFFGLTRSLRWTIPSIRSRVLSVLQDGGMEYDTFVHTYNVAQVNNFREESTALDYLEFAEDYRALDATRSLVTDQDDLDLAWPNPLSLTYYNWNYKVDVRDNYVRNIFRAYWSMGLVWGLMAEHAKEEGLEYDAVVLLRPDVWFHVNIDLPTRQFPLPEDLAYMPSFETTVEAGKRKNDRFAYGSVAAMRVLMNRLSTFVEADAGRFTRDMTKQPIDSEWVLGHHLQKNNVSAEAMFFPVSRVRLDGSIPERDHTRVEAACKGGYDPIACDMVKERFRMPGYRGEEDA